MNGLNDLNFATLRVANKLRLPLFKNSQGQPAHSKPDGSDWTPSDWLEALVGEVGELANWHKKFRRGDITQQFWEQVAWKELADIATYLDLLALRILDLPGQAHPEGVDLGAAVAAKFNEVSERVGCDVRIASTCVGAPLNVYQYQSMLYEPKMEKPWHAAKGKFEHDLNAAPRDITLPDGTVRHNVGGDNLSDEDRVAMAVQNEQGTTGTLWRSIQTVPEDDHTAPRTVDPKTTHMILVKPHEVFVKEIDFFREQGGFKSEWGYTWIGVEACGIEHARAIGECIRDEK